MTALTQDVVADLRRRVAELEQRLQSSLDERDEAIAQQAATAVENTRLLTELRTTRDRQAGSAEILRAIAGASGDAEQSLQQIAETTARLFGASSVTLNIASGGEWVRMIRVGPSSQRVGSELSAAQLRNLPATVFRENRQIHIPDLDNLDPAITDWPSLPHARAAGARAMAGTPLRREGKAIGALIVHRDRPTPFTDEELALLQSFADQAVIAIENARLFNETREALERQTATADILKVIASSPSDVQPVFEAIATSANRLIGGYSTAVHSLVNDTLYLSAFTPTSPAADAALQALFPRPLSAFGMGEQMRNGEIVHIPDVEVEGAMLPDAREVAHMRGFRSLLRVPLLRDRVPIGFISVTRAEPGRFADHHVQLLQIFADQAVIAIENAQLFNETQEALERQTATADILKVIASSPSDVQPVFEAIAESARRLSGGHSAAVTRVIGDMNHLAAFTAGSEAGTKELHSSFPSPLSGPGINNRVARTGELALRTDIETDPDVPQAAKELARARGYRSILVVPMLRDGVSIGTIGVTRRDPGPFSDHLIGLLKTFADQAVIAIENVRLFNETKEALERQTATADILKVIASSPSDVQPVFEAIAERSNRLVEGLSTAVYSIVDDTQHLMAFTRRDPEADATLQALFPRPLSAVAWGEQIRNGEIFHVSDTEVELSTQPSLLELARKRGFRSSLLVPLLRDRTPIGLISVTRAQPGRFAAHHVQLLQTFADQAVIAIENTRLFNETREALERQTATADILKVIAGSPSDVQPVFEAIATSANRLIGGFSATVFRFVDDVAHLAAFTPTSPAADAALQASFPRPLSAISWGEQMRNGELVHIPDVEVEGAMLPDLRDLARMRGFRSMHRVPLLRDRAPIGFINVTRVEPGRFAAHHIQLLQTFADQAVIAIENTRLFNETREALERQTATADILKVIAGSPSDVQPVFEAIATSANRLIGGHSTAVLRFFDGAVHLAAFTPTSPAADEVLKASLPRPLTNFPPFEWLRKGEAVQIADAETVPEARDVARARGYRSVLFAPLMSNGAPIGLIGVTRKEPGAFAAHHVQLLQTFADQAVIAIENTRLFNETREALERQTATADILKVIASSPSDVQPVFDAIATSANRLLAGFSTAVFRFVDGVSHLAAFTPTTPAADEILKASFPRRIEFAQAGETVQITDTETSTDARIRDIARARFP